MHDSKTWKHALAQQQRLTGTILKNNFIDRGYRGAKEIPGTKIIIPDNPVNREQLMKSNSYEKDLKEERLLNLKSVI